MAYRFPDSSSCGPKKSRVPFETGYGEAAREAFHQVMEQFLPDAIDETELLAGAYQLLAQEEYDLAADWMEDLAAYMDRCVAALDAAGFAPEQNWRCQKAGVATRYREAAEEIRTSTAAGAEVWIDSPEDAYISPALRREVLQLVKFVDANCFRQPFHLGYQEAAPVSVEVPGPTLRGTFQLPTRRAHAVAQLLQGRPDLLIDPPATPKKVKVPKRAPRPRRAPALPAQLTAAWIRNPRGHIVAGGMPLFPELMESTR